MDRAQRIELARSLGHGQLSMGETASSRRFWVRCSCGWGAPFSDGRPTITRATKVEAVKTLQWHLEKAVSDHLVGLRKNGAASSPFLMTHEAAAG